MCEPITLAALSVGATALAGGTSAIGQIQAGNAAERRADFQAQVARNNAIIARRRAEDVEERAGIEEERLRRQTEQIKGRQRAAFASNNLLLGEGSPLTVLEDTAQLGELDALTLRSNAEREALGLRTQSSQFLDQARIFSAAGDSAKRASRIGAFSTILGTAGKIGTQFGGQFGGGGGSRAAAFNPKANRAFSDFFGFQVRN